MLSENNKTTESGDAGAIGSIKTYSLGKLFLDPNNYRLINEHDYVQVPESLARDKQVQRRTFRLLTGTKNQNIRDLVDSFKAKSCDGACGHFPWKAAMPIPTLNPPCISVTMSDC